MGIEQTIKREPRKGRKKFNLSFFRPSGALDSLPARFPMTCVMGYIPLAPFRGLLLVIHHSSLLLKVLVGFLWARVPFTTLAFAFFRALERSERPELVLYLSEARADDGAHDLFRGFIGGGGVVPARTPLTVLVHGRPTPPAASIAS